MMLAQILAVLLVAAVAPAAAQPFTFAAIGDMPYDRDGDPTGEHVRFGRLIAELNRREPAFTIHVGDIKSGSTPCTDERMQLVLEHFMRFQHPLIYTPGDNEWTDCHRARINHQPVDPIERLAAVRGTFFRDDLSLGQRRLPLTRQNSDPRFARFVENLRWTHNNVMFATVHVVGSNNNLQRNRAAVEEHLARNAANLAWLRAAFDEARAQNRAALAIAMQANPEFDLPPDRRSGFNDTLALLQEQTLAFGRPVLLIHGDSHYFRIDQPMVVAGRRVETFTRLEVYGERDVQGVVVGVDTGDPLAP